MRYAVLLLLLVSSLAQAASKPCSPLLTNSYLGLLNFMIEGIDEISDDAFGHEDRVQIKVKLLQEIASSLIATNPLNGPMRSATPRNLTHFSAKLSTLVESAQFEHLTASLSKNEWKRVRQAVQTKLRELQNLQAAQTVAKPATQADFEDQPDQNGNTRLHRLIINNRFAEAHQLVESSQISYRYLNLRNFVDQTALDILETSPKNPDSIELTKLMHAKEALHAKKLLRYDRELYSAAKSGNLSKIQDLYDGGADVNHHVITSNSETTPLLAASLHGSPEAVRLLLKLGANINFVGRNGLSILNYAIRNNAELATIEALLEEKPDLEKIDSNQRTAFMHATDHCRTDIMKALVLNGALAKLGKWGLWTVCDDSYTAVNEVIKTLIELGVNLENRELPGLDSHLYDAVKNRKLHLVRALLENGAYPNFSHEDGKALLLTNEQSFELDKSLIILRIDKKSEVQGLAEYEGIRDLLQKHIDKLPLNERDGDK